MFVGPGSYMASETKDKLLGKPGPTLIVSIHLLILLETNMFIGW